MTDEEAKVPGRGLAVISGTELAVVDQKATALTALSLIDPDTVSTTALSLLDDGLVDEVLYVARRTLKSPGAALPTVPGLAELVGVVHAAAKADQQGVEKAVIREFIEILADRRGLPLPKPVALDMDAVVMSQWPADLFRKAARQVWECFAEPRVPSPPDFRRYIEEDLAERRTELAALHTLELRLATLARTGEQIPRDSFDGGGKAEFV